MEILIMETEKNPEVIVYAKSELDKLIKQEFDNASIDLKKNINRLIRANDLTQKKLNAHHELFEILFSEYEINPTGIRNKLQLLDQELIRFIDNICYKYDFEYWLDFGTLLGAVRHNGFIPWDDDTDLCMIRKDFEKIFPIIKEEIKKQGLEKEIRCKKYHINNRVYLIGFIQISYHAPNNIPMGSVDIIPYDYQKNKQHITKEQIDKERLNFHMKLLNGENKQETLEDYINKFNITYENSNFLIPGIEVWWAFEKDLNSIENDIIFPLKEMKFKDYYFKVPNKPEERLKDEYGDYSRFPQSLHHHNLVKKLKKIQNIDEYYDNAIEKLKTINDNF